MSESSYPNHSVLLQSDNGKEIIYNHDGLLDPDDKYLEIFWKDILRDEPSSTENANQIPFDFSLPIEGVVKKHRLVKPKSEGDGNTSAVLCDTKSFAFFLEYCLCFQSYCHYGHLLPLSDRGDLSVVDFGARRIVSYFDTFIYRGDNTCDSDTCKMHCQIRTASNIKKFGDMMQTNCNMGERGLRSWAKHISITAQKQGYHKFSFQTGNRVSDQLILFKAFDNINSGLERGILSSEEDNSTNFLKRKNPHFIIKKKGTKNLQIPMDRNNKQGKIYVSKTGTLPEFVVNAIFDHEPEQEEINVWTEVTLKKEENQIIRACPNYRGEGPWYDWIHAKFKGSHKDKNQLFPAKLLAIYENNQKQMKALVHSVEYKKNEGEDSLVFGDSKLIQHYLQEFLDNGFPAMRSINIDDIFENILVYQNIKYSKSPIPPKISLKSERKKHTIMVVLPRRRWAKTYIEWSRELKFRDDNNKMATCKHKLDYKLTVYESRKMKKIQKIENQSFHDIQISSNSE